MDEGGAQLGGQLQGPQKPPGLFKPHTSVSLFVQQRMPQLGSKSEHGVLSGTR